MTFKISAKSLSGTLLSSKNSNLSDYQTPTPDTVRGLLVLQMDYIERPKGSKGMCLDTKYD